MVTAVAVERFLAILARHGRPKEMYMALVEQLCADHVPGLIESSDLERVLQSPSIFLVHALQHGILEFFGVLHAHSDNFPTV